MTFSGVLQETCGNSSLTTAKPSAVVEVEVEVATMEKEFATVQTSVEEVLCLQATITVQEALVQESERTCLSSSERKCSQPPHLTACHLPQGAVTEVPVEHLVAGLITAPVGRLTLDRHCRSPAVRGRKTATVLMMVKMPGIRHQQQNPLVYKERNQDIKETEDCVGMGTPTQGEEEVER